MEKKKITYWSYFWKSVKWIFGNTLFGVFPLIFMCAIYRMSDEKLGGNEIDNLIYEGAVLFVCIAMVGGVLVDFYLSGVRLGGFARFATYCFPACILFIISVNYFLIHIKVIDKSRFALSSLTTISIVVLSAFYITFVKTNLYMKEDLRHEPVI